MKTLTIFALFGTLLMFTACGGNGEQEEGMPDEDGQEEMMDEDTMHEGEVDATVVYYCPMECEGDKTYDEPGTCPACGMDLVERHMDDAHMHEGDEHMHEGDAHTHEGDAQMRESDEHMHE